MKFAIYLDAIYMSQIHKHKLVHIVNFVSAYPIRKITDKYWRAQSLGGGGRGGV